MKNKIKLKFTDIHKTVIVIVFFAHENEAFLIYAFVHVPIIILILTTIRRICFKENIICHCTFDCTFTVVYCSFFCTFGSKTIGTCTVTKNFFLMENYKNVI